MQTITTEHLTELLTEHAPPCVSLYQPTYRTFPESRENPIRYKNLLRDLNESLDAERLGPDGPELLEKFAALTDDNEFWEHRTDGLAVFGSKERFKVFDLQRPVIQQLVVADSFHTKPLCRILQSADRFQILCLNRQQAKLYEGNRDALDPVDLAGIPATISEALGAELTEPHQTVASYGGSGGAHSAHGSPAMHHGHGSKKDEVEIDIVRFFRAIDRAILEHYSRPTGLPLMLAALAEYHEAFRSVSRNPFLMDDGIMMNPEAISIDDLRAAAWQVLEPQYLQRLHTLTENYGTARSQKLGTDDLAEAARAAAAGRVGTLLVEANRQLPGRIDSAVGELTLGAEAHPNVDDALDDLAEMILRMKGEVVVVPADKMPTTTGLAAIYRY